MTQQDFFNRYSYKPATDKLGGGAFGKVYKAYDTVLDKYVAIKVAEQMEVEGRVFSLSDEFKALENLPDNVNIAKYEQLYSFESPQGLFDYAIMQYYPDGNLSQLIHRQQLSHEQKESLALQLLKGIGFLHDNKVVHRDLKPSNILIHKRMLAGTNEYIPKITDFGLSKKANAGKGTHFTNSIAAGTYAYSSPEQLRGEELRFNTDLWAYGAMVYEIFTGKTLFQVVKKSGSSTMDIREVLDNILKSDISAKIKELPARWQPVVLACLERDAQKRVNTVDVVWDKLNEKEIVPSKPTKEETQVLDKGGSVMPPKEDKPILGYTTTSQPSRDSKPNRLPFFIGLGIVVVAMVAFLVWKSNKGDVIPNPGQDSTLAKHDSMATPVRKETTEVVPAWKTTFDQQFAALQKAEAQNTEPTNLEKYKALLATLPTTATDEKKQVNARIDYFTKLITSHAKPAVADKELTALTLEDGLQRIGDVQYSLDSRKELSIKILAKFENPNVPVKVLRNNNEYEYFEIDKYINRILIQGIKRISVKEEIKNNSGLTTEIIVNE